MSSRGPEQRRAGVCCPRPQAAAEQEIRDLPAQVLSALLGGLGGLVLAPAQSRGVRVVAACSGCGDRPLGREVGPHLGLPGVQSPELRGSRGLCHLNLEMLCKRGAGAAPWGVGENMTCGGP